MPINIDGSKGIPQNTTETTQIPVGTTAQRPANPAAGLIRFNTDRGLIEWYDPITDIWSSVAFDVAVVATGGTVTDIEQDGKKFRVHTFTSDGTFDVTRGGEVEHLVVGGGGAGGNFWGGGGGGGGVIMGLDNLSPQTYSIVVGAGGLQSSTEDGTADNKVAGGDGVNSSAFNFTAIGGGGGGGDDSKSGRSGGSGGGGGGGGDGGLRTPGQGNNGGNSITSAWVSNGIGGGGGGGSQPGFDSDTVNSQSAKGGGGISSFITGSSVFYAGGGGGGNSNGGDEGNYEDRNAGLPGLGGGGRGQNRSRISTRPNESGAPNTGGGGGGSDTRFMPASFGGSGIVIVRYRIG